MTDKQIQPYGAWESPLTVEKLSADSPVGFGQIRSHGDDLLWVESRAHEGGRRVVVLHRDGNDHDVTPKGYSVVSRVHEYGGVAYCVGVNTIYFVNAKDQNIYAQSLDVPFDISQTTKSDANERFADPVFDPHANRLLCIRERHYDDREADNDIVEVNLESGEIGSIHEGHDFYAHARLSPDGSKIAFLAWDHPNMPWNGTQLYVMNLSSSEVNASIVAGGQSESIFQPEWVTNDLLVFASDRSGFYDLYAFGDEGTYTIAADEREYGHALWQLGSTQFTALNDRLLLANPNQAELVLVDTFNGMQTPVESGAASYRELTKHKDGVVYVQSHVDSTSSIQLRESFTAEPRTIKTAGKPPIDRDYISTAERVEFEGSLGETVFAYYYAPRNPKFEADPSERPSSACASARWTDKQHIFII